jgi:predicted amidophosphoribosyltransferase
MDKQTSCSECGAGLQAGSALCALCGTSSQRDKTWGDRKPKPEPEPSVDDYQKDLRALRAKLKALRDDAEAV